jgi:ADP-heptose:LPS heptosyltransferase
MNRIAIIHAGAIGDLVQTFPMLRAVRAKWPAAHVSLIGRPARILLARMAGLCDACLDLDASGLWRVLRDPKADGPLPACLAGADLVIDCLSKPPAPVRTAPEFVRLEPLPPADWTEPAAGWIFREAARRLDLPAVPLVPELAIPPAAIESARRVLADRRCREPFFAIQPGSGSLRKNWPVERFAELTARARHETGRPILWLLGPAETDRGILPPADARDTVLTEAPLDQVAALLSLAGLYIGNDSGVTQIAGGVRRADGAATPTVALFGPTDPRVWAPQGSHVRVVRSQDGTMDGVSLESVWAGAAGLLATRGHTESGI